MAIIYTNTVNVSAETFKNCNTITSVDCNYTPWANNNMGQAFLNCENLTTVTNINNNVTNMWSTFLRCPNLVNAPVIPNSVQTMCLAFCNCSSLVNAPVIPNSVTNMLSTFGECTNLVNAPEIPNSVYTLRLAFLNCTNLVEAPSIPNSVTSMKQTFKGCTNLTGDIYINGLYVSDASECFEGTELIKNVYFAFQYSNNIYTATYNAFTNAGYDTEGTKDGVYLVNYVSPIK